MTTRRTMPGPCVLCGAAAGRRTPVGWECGVCGWNVGDVPDPDLERPRIEVVYYLRFAERIKIGTSRDPRRRLAVIRHDELLAFERGGRDVERARHERFADCREGGEWFTATPELTAFVTGVRDGADPWDRLARWTAEALRPLA